MNLLVSKPKLAFGLFSLTLLTAFALLPGLPAQLPPPDKRVYVVLGSSANESTIDLKRSQTVLIVLPTQPGTGYAWRIVRAGQAPGTIEKLSPTDIKELNLRGILRGSSSKEMPGETESQVFRLQPKSAGTTGVELQYIRPWEPKKSGQKFVVIFRILPS